MNSDLVSILMPVKNAGNTIHDCLDSILKQTYANWQLIAINDNSTDNSVSIIKAYCKKDNRIGIYENPGVGIVDAMSHGFGQSKGGFITRMDEDDIMHPDKLFELKKGLAAEMNKTIAVCHVEYFSNEALGSGYLKYEKRINRLVKENRVFNEIYKECVIPSCAWMIKKSDAIEFGLFEDLKIPEDYDFCFRLYANRFKVIPVNKKLHKWRDHASRTSRIDPLYDIRSFGLFKLKHFLKNEVGENETIVIWGAGEKGKEMIRYLESIDHKHLWITTNKRKLGQTIYNTKLKKPEQIIQNKPVKIVLAVSNPNDQEEISNYLKKSGFNAGLDYFIFF